MTNFKYLNTNKTVALGDLIKSEDVTDKTIIQVFDAEGKFMTKGNWYQDNLLEYSEAKGIARKPGTGLTVNFRLIGETDEAVDLLLGGDGLTNVLENLAAQLRKEAINAAMLMNSQAKDGDVFRNHTNYGALSQTLRTLHHMGYEAENATWGDGDMLICEKVTVNGAVIYQRN